MLGQVRPAYVRLVQVVTFYFMLGSISSGYVRIF
jgi:hypothetical protein